MIVKIQIPIGGDLTRALIYNENRTILELAPIKIARKAFGKSKDLKGYFKAKLIKTILHINERVYDEDF